MSTGGLTPDWSDYVDAAENVAWWVERITDAGNATRNELEALETANIRRLLAYQRACGTKGAEENWQRFRAEDEARLAGRSPVDSGTGCEKHGRTDCEDCYLDALAPPTRPPHLKSCPTWGLKQ